MAGTFTLVGSQTGKRLQVREPQANVWEIADVTDNVSFLQFDKVNSRINSPTYGYYHQGVKVAEYSSSDDKVHVGKDIYSEAVGASLGSHASRHNRGGADAIDWSSISQLFDSGDVSCAVGTGGTASKTTVYSLPSSWFNLVPLAVNISVGGTVASGETINVSVRAVLDDGTELEIASYSVTGSTGSKLESAPFANLLTSAASAGKSLEGRRITTMVAYASSSATSTSATVTVRVIGIRT